MADQLQVLLGRAAQYVQSLDPRAEQAFAAVLEQDPANMEARIFLARVAMQAGRPGVALAHLQVANGAYPDNASLWRSLGICYAALEQWPDSQTALEHCLRLAPKMHAARLHLGKAYERQGRRSDSVKTYLQALSRAQRDGLWLDAASTPVWLASDVQHAIEVAHRGRLEIHEALMQPLFTRFGKQALQRVDACVRGVLGFENLKAGGTKQKPSFMYFPGLPETPVFDRALFPWFEQLESGFEAIRLEAVTIRARQNAMAPFLSLGQEDRVSDYLGGQKPNWNAYFFYRHGAVLEDHHIACPNTSLALGALPLVRIAEHAPEICFSLLSAGTHILPHYGTSNIRSVVHLPLLVPDNCALKVQDIIVEGKAGKCFAFDDTFLHEAWNRSDSDRIILLMDTWNPHLQPEECAALTSIIEAIGHFNQ